MSELFLWADALPEGYKIALFTTCITVIGFLIAFHTATLNWKAQMKADMCSKAAFKIQDFTNDYLTDLVDYNGYVEQLIKTLDDIDEDPASSDTHFNTQHSIDITQQHITTRDRLSKATSDIHRLFGTYSHLQTSVPGLKKSMKHVTKAMKKIFNHLYIHVPLLCNKLTAKSTPEEVRRSVDCFIKNVDRDKCQKFLDAFNEHHNVIATHVGRINGDLHADVSFRASHLLWLMLKERSGVLENMQETNNHANKHDGY